MPLFQQSVLNKYLASQDTTEVKSAYKKYSAYFLNKEIQQNIRNSKEEQFQEGFLRELFVNVLGYTINPNAGFNLTTELKNIKDAKKTDGAILNDNGAALAVIELKGTDTKDLAKVNDQAFNYKNNQPECVYVITSNFEKLRFFIHNAVEHQEFNLFTLTEERFKLLWLFLQKDNLLSGIPAKVKEESLLQEDKITKALYADYSAFKNDLWNDMVLRNPQHDPLLLYQKSQKLLDRFLFIFFAEDKGLLPPNSISVIVQQWNKLKELDEYKPLYDRFKKYFGYMNDGYKGAKYEIHAYNGGLFKQDTLLDGLLITDNLIEKHTLKLTKYDFADEVDTNILGHIFEHSLNDIENVRAQLAGEEVDKSKTKRKKDGVFYTPKYITKYIVDNTIGKLCEEKKAEIGIDDEEFAKDRKGRKKATIKKLDAQLKEYREWLLQLTICDPACGSGAFLNQALEFLMAEHRYVDELEAQLFEGSIVFPDVENHILENNIYGVDINEESVEIARLSLWLRTAQKGRKLTSLSSNIKCGNSLIDDPEVACDLAFNWQEQFPKVFAKGGFDVVIGNPPYVNFKMYSSTDRDFYKIKYNEIFNGKADLLYYFFYHSLDILKSKGALGFITSRYWLEAEYAMLLRNVISVSTEIKKILDFKNITVFEDAGVKSNITILRKKAPNNNSVAHYYNFFGKKIVDIHTAIEVDKFDVLQSSLLLNEDWKFFPKLTLNLIAKIKSKGVLLDTICHCLQGVITGADKIFVINETDKFWGEVEEQYLKDWIKVGDIHRYAITPVVKRKVVYTELINPSDIPRSVNNYLRLHHEKLSNRSGVKNGEYSWIGWHRYRNKEYINQPKLVTRFKASHNTFAIDLNNSYSSADLTHVIIKEENKKVLSLEFLCGLLNSKLLDFYFKSYGKLMDYRYEYYPSPVGKLSVIISDVNTQENISQKVRLLSENMAKIKTLEISFNQLIQLKLPVKKNIIIDIKSMSLNSFINELKKAKVPKMSLEDEAQWMEYFNKKKAEANALQTEIDRIDKEIDQIVYSLYGLTEEEIRIVEAT